MRNDKDDKGRSDRRKRILCCQHGGWYQISEQTGHGNALQRGSLCGGGNFTTNLVKAAPVKWDQKIVYESKKAQAVVINAGIANACTGEEGMRYCRQTAEKVGELLPVPKDRCSWHRPE